MTSRTNGGPALRGLTRTGGRGDRAAVAGLARVKHRAVKVPLLAAGFTLPTPGRPARCSHGTARSTRMPVAHRRERATPIVAPAPSRLALARLRGPAVPVSRPFRDGGYPCAARLPRERAGGW